MITLTEIAIELKKWFPLLLKNSFVSSADNFNKANGVELPYAVIIPQITEVMSAPSLRNPSNDFLLSLSFKIEFYLNIKPLKDKKGQETPFWAYVSYEQEITSILYKNIAQLFFIKDEELLFENQECFLSDNALIICYNFKHNYCITSFKEKEDYLISRLIIDNIDIKDEKDEY